MSLETHPQIDYVKEGKGAIAQYRVLSVAIGGNSGGGGSERPVEGLLYPRGQG